MKKSAGILLYRSLDSETQIFLCHPGGPFYRKKDEGVWTIPKGEFEDGEEPIEAARREFREETGHEAMGPFTEMKPVVYKDKRKIVYAWAVRGNIEATSIKSNVFPLEWPPKSGKFIEIPEVDRAEWFGVENARKKILASLLPLLDEFASMDIH